MCSTRVRLFQELSCVRAYSARIGEWADNPDKLERITKKVHQGKTQSGASLDDVVLRGLAQRGGWGRGCWGERLGRSSS